MPDHAERDVEFYEIMSREPVDENGVQGHVAEPVKPIDWIAELEGYETRLGTITDDEKLQPAFSQFTERSDYVLQGRMWRPLEEQRPGMVDLLVLRRVRRGEGGYVVLNIVTGEEEAFGLGEDEGIAHETHVAFFENNIVGVIRNGQGAPNVKHVTQFLSEKLAFRKLTIEPLVYASAAARIAPQGVTVYDATLRIPPSTAELAAVEQQEDLSDAASFLGHVRQEANELFGTDVRVELRVFTRKLGPVATKNSIKQFTQTAEGLAQGKPERTRVKAIEDGMSSAFDLAKNAITRKVKVTLKPLTEAVDGGPMVFQPESTSGRLKSAQDNLQQQIQEAAQAEAGARDVSMSSWRAKLLEGQETDDGGAN